ncbi:MAG: glycosyltransferase [Aulosira sp. ZfuVER01]|nr:glycosyltransferase [Aulosira sp. ZfuVER01]MDZ7999200.1 glycosyltransferase [Aulosira sp. DedVER01a]MDZ8052019.1 glycosyltransferase [Aulosira sp. ZfuCHP01]
MPTISVVIPVYNGEKTIKRTIESVLKQNFNDLEVIVINDGSTDSTEEIIKSIPDSRLKIFSYPNAGLPASRNRGLSLASCDFVSFIDADDIWTCDKLESQLQLLLVNKSAAVAYSWTDYIDADGEYLRSGLRVKVTGDAYSNLLLSNFLENGSNPLIRKEAFTKVGNFDESLRAAEDWDMWLRLASQYEFVVVPKVQILYRVTTNSMSSNCKNQETESLKVIERAFAHPKAASLQHKKNYALARLYQYLTFQVLKTSQSKRKSWIAAQFFWTSLKYEPSLLEQRRLILTAVLKIILAELHYQVGIFKHPQLS